MDTDILDQMRIESRLAESVCIRRNNNGYRVVAMNGYIVDYPTFCTMLVWYISDVMGYSKILQERTGLIPTLKNLNQWDKDLKSLTGYNAINHLYISMFKSARGHDKKEFSARFLEMIRESQ